MSTRIQPGWAGLHRRGLACLFLLGLSCAAQSAAAATFTQSFTPSTIGPGSASLLSFTITNGGASALTALAFTDTLPAGISLAGAPLAQNSCGGSLSAPANGATLTLDAGRLAVGESCLISAYVVSSTAGVHSNTTGDLTNSGGNDGTSNADLTVSTTLPGFSKAYSPASAKWRDRVTLTYTIDNSANPTTSGTASVSVSDLLPGGMVVANPSNAVTNCPLFFGVLPATIVAEPGTSSLSFSQLAFNASAICTISVDVSAGNVGNFAHASSGLAIGGSNAGLSVAALAVTADTVNLTQHFEDGPFTPGQPGAVVFRITNTSRSESATALTFSDDLDTMLSGLIATGTPLSNICGSGSTLSGSGTLSLSGGTLAPGASCEFSVPLLIPAGAANGFYPGTTGALSGTLGATGFANVAGATDTLWVAAAPVLAKSFSAGTVGAGQSITLTYTLTNPSDSATLTAFSLVDGYGNLPSGTPTGPSAGACGAGSTFVVAPVGPTVPASLTASGLNLVAGASCNFAVTFMIADGVRNGVFGSSTSSASGTLGSETVAARITEDSFAVVSPPTLSFELANSFVVAGGSSALNVVLSNNNRGQDDADVYDDFSQLAFSLDLDSALSGLLATGLPASNVCGAGSQITGSGVLALSNGALAAKSSCSFSVPLAVPSGAASGIYTLTSSNPSGLARGVTTSGNAAVTKLIVGGLGAVQEFTDDPVAPGGSVNLRFTLTNRSTSEAASNITLSQTLGRVVSGLAATGLPVAACGGTLSGSTTLSLTGGSLAAGESCVFDVALSIPGGTTPNNYASSTNSVIATFAGGGPTVFPNATSLLKIEATGVPRDLSLANLDEADADSDGFPNEQNIGDGDINDDGIPDALQANVASIVSTVTGQPVALTVDAGCIINSFAMVDANTLGTSDGITAYPEGLASFDLTCESSQVTLTLPGASLAGSVQVRKYGKVAPDFAGPSLWYAVPGGVVDKTTKTIRFNVTDAGLGDNTGDDGHIVDPVGPGMLAPIAIPTVSPAMMAMLILALGVFGCFALRRGSRWSL